MLVPIHFSTWYVLAFVPIIPFFPQIYWDILTKKNTLKVYYMTAWYRHTLWNGDRHHQANTSIISDSYQCLSVCVCVCGKNTYTHPLSKSPAHMWYTTTNCDHHAVRQAFTTHSSHNWEFVPFDQCLPIPPISFYSLFLGVGFLDYTYKWDHVAFTQHIPSPLGQLFFISLPLTC